MVEGDWERKEGNLGFYSSLYAQGYRMAYVSMGIWHGDKS